MPNISFHVEDIYKLLNNLNIYKSPGSDEIPTRILKFCAMEIAPILQIIFTQSMATGNLPDDWLTANITPVYKKGNRSTPHNYRSWNTLSITTLWSIYNSILLYFSLSCT